MRYLPLLAILSVACSSSPVDSPPVTPPPPPATVAASPGTTSVADEEPLFAASDGLGVHATFDDPKPGEAKPVVVMAHQMCKDRDEWKHADHDWVSALNAKGIATLRIDLRGHGASQSWPDGSHHDLCKEIGDDAVKGLYKAMVEDVRAAVAWARDKGGASTVAVVGASIGANSALVVFGDDDALRAVIALSPGTDYRDIKPAEAVVKSKGRRVAMLAAEDDKRSADAVRELSAASQGVDAKIHTEGKHGNAVVVAHPEELPRLVAWLADALK
jgi:alpha/beta superfamily hydrolase